MKALSTVALQGPEKRELPMPFHALCNDTQLEVSPHSDHCGHDGRIVRIGGNVTHEQLVDLQGFNREALQITQTRIAGT